MAATTASQTIGPYWHIIEDKSLADLTRFGAAGEKIVLTGRILDGDGAPCSDAVVRGEIMIAPLIYNIVYPKKRDGAPLDAIYAPEGIPIVPYGSGITVNARHPNAAKLYMDWILSDEGQAMSIRDQGNLTSLKNPPLTPDMFDPAKSKPWVPEFGPFQSLHDGWIEEWNKIYGYRQ